ncbi:MAG TPA: NUDIX domain-containing protein [Acetobacteraceae bacterium]|nr:NUDIX domain-containing protein [Acetobacteraceae bacterium]
MSAAPLPSSADFQVESDQRVWNGRFPLHVVRFRQRRFDGTLSVVRTWELWHRGRAAAVLPYDPVQDAVVLVEQFRLPALAAGLDPVLVEVPAGLCDGTETAEQTIRREAQEETGISPDRLERIGEFILSAGASDEVCTLFAGRVHAPAAGTGGIAGHHGSPAEHEDIRVRVWSADSAIDAALAGRIPNSIAALALLWLNARRANLRAEWMHT